MAEQKSVWAWIGVGCVALLVVGTLVVVGGGYVLYRETRQFAQETQDPAGRAKQVLEVLGTDAVPRGYYPVVGMSLPFGLFRLAILSDEPPDASGHPALGAKRGLLYVEAIYSGQDEQELRDYFEGKTDDAAVLHRNKINVDVAKVLGRGVVTLGPAQAMYLAQRGSVSAHGYSGEGIMSLVLIDCPEDQRMRLALWYGPEPEAAAGRDSATPPAEVSLDGTPADRQAILDFFTPFRFCA